MSRVFFFNRYIHPDHSATSQLLADVAFRLAGEGRGVTLVGSAQRYDDAAAELPRHERVDGVELRRIGGTRFGRASLLGRAIDYLSYLVGAALLLLRDVRRGDVVVAMTDPPMLGAVLGPLARVRRARCVHWVQDLFPEVAEVLLGERWRGWRVAPLRWLRDRSLVRADRVVAISPAMASRIAGIGVDPRRISVIENWTDDASIVPIDPTRNALRRDWNLEGCFVVGYSGNLGRAHDWRTMLEVASAFRDRPEIRFLLVGDGKGMRDLAAAVRQRGLTNVLFKPYQPRTRLSESLALPDLHWLSLLPGLDGLIFPSKLYGILAAGRPSLLVGDVRGEISDVLRRAGAGWTVASGDAGSAVELIDRLAVNRGVVTSAGSAARILLEAGRLRSDAIRRWAQVLTRDA